MVLLGPCIPKNYGVDGDVLNAFQNKLKDSKKKPEI